MKVPFWRAVSANAPVTVRQKTSPAHVVSAFRTCFRVAGAFLSLVAVVAVFFASTSTAHAAGLPVATNITSGSANIGGTFGANGADTEAFFDFGLTAGYGQRIKVLDLPAGIVSISSSPQITPLTPGQTYHFRAVASNSFGTTLGADMTFTALAAVPLAVTNPVGAVTVNSATLNGQASLRGSPGSTFFQLGTDTSYGQPLTVGDC